MTFEEKFPQLAEFVKSCEQQEHDDEFAEGRAAVRYMRDIARVVAARGDAKTKADYVQLVQDVVDLVDEYEDGAE